MKNMMLDLKLLTKLISTYNWMEDYFLPEDQEEVTDELEIIEHTGVEKIQKRAWLIQRMDVRKSINTCSWTTRSWKNYVDAYDGLCTCHW